MNVRRAKRKDLNRINDLLLQVCMVHHKGRPDLFKFGAKKYSDEELIQILEDEERQGSARVHWRLRSGQLRYRCGYGSSQPRSARF